jgi:Flp pilus assembly protein TadD
MAPPQTRQWSQSYPNENDLATWESAFILAPQLPNIRFGYARALMQSDKNEEAIVLMTPIANAPHNAGQAAAAQQMIDRARAGQAPLSEETLEAAADEPSQPPTDGAPPQ